MSAHRWRVVKTNPYWWTAIAPRGTSHGYSTWDEAMRVATRASRLGVGYRKDT